MTTLHTRTTNNTSNTQVHARQRRVPRGQRGVSIENFLFWMILASLAVLGVIGGYNKGMSMLNAYTTNGDVVQMKAAVEDFRGGQTDLSDITIAKVCEKGNGNKGATFCGKGRDGKNANPYGGDYTLKVSARSVSNVDVGITKVDEEYTKSLGNKLTRISADHCDTLDACSTVTVASTTVTVTL
ncbi:hypothetical protein [Photobacterium indicum]|uniref:hypothetical protein n=1 Tax=Photobacterium indicum TaxID=81447 RepID=UPI003D0ECB33